MDEGHHDGGAFGDEDGVAEAFGFILEILNGAEAALFTEEAEFVEGGGAFAFDAQALGHEEETALVGDGGEGFAPDFVAEEDAGVVEVDGVEVGFGDDALGEEAEFVGGDGGDGFFAFDEFADVMEEGVAFRLGLGDIFFGLAEAAGGGGERRGQDGGGEGSGHGKRRRAGDETLGDAKVARQNAKLLCGGAGWALVETHPEGRPCQKSVGGAGRGAPTGAGASSAAPGAGSFEAPFIAAGFDAHGAGFGAEAEAAGDAVFQ